MRMVENSYKGPAPGILYRTRRSSFPMRPNRIVEVKSVNSGSVHYFYNDGGRNNEGTNLRGTIAVYSLPCHDFIVRTEPIL